MRTQRDGGGGGGGSVAVAAAAAAAAFDFCNPVLGFLYLVPHVLQLAALAHGLHLDGVLDNSLRH